MKIIIEGPQGSGRTLIAEALRAMLTLAGKTVVVDDRELAPMPLSLRRPYSGKPADVVIYTRLGK
jgi:hypothetical protein